MIGQKIGQYKIIRELGSGGMGTVYEAYQESLNRHVAIKILPFHLSKDKDLVERFRREAKAVAKLNHARIVQIYDIGEHEGMYYFAMELIKGQTLTEIIKQRGALSCEDALSITFQVAEALECAHKEGIVHRDIKSGNIMIDNNGHVKVTDFGIAKAVESEGITLTGTIMGTPEYMSPEQAKGEKTDSRSDIYSLGIVLYEMLTGEVPFKAETPYGVMQQHINVEAKPVPEVNPDLQWEVEFIVRKCLIKDLSYRYQTATEILEDINKYRAGAFHPSPISTSSEVSPQKKGRRKLLIIVFSVIIIAIVGVVLGKRFSRQTLKPSIPPSSASSYQAKEQDEIEQLFSKGDGSAKEKQYSQAMMYYQKIIDNYPVTLAADNARTKITYIKKKIDEEKIETLFNRAQDMENKGEIIKAISSYQEIVIKYPDTKCAKLAKEAIKRIEEFEKTGKGVREIREEPLTGPEKKIVKELEKLIEKDMKLMGLTMTGDPLLLENYLLQNHYEEMNRIGKIVGLEAREFTGICARIMMDEFGPPPSRDGRRPDVIEEGPMFKAGKRIKGEIEKLMEADMKLMGLAMKGDRRLLENYLLKNRYNDMKRIGKMMGLGAQEFAAHLAKEMCMRPSDRRGPPRPREDYRRRP
ncbi:protein kinase [bacterium]|nr:protein kinase [bacterium]